MTKKANQTNGTKRVFGFRMKISKLISFFSLSLVFFAFMFKSDIFLCIKEFFFNFV